MKKLIFATCLIAPTLSFAEVNHYVEVQVGRASADDIDTKTYYSAETGNVSASLDYDDSTSFGFEWGIRPASLKGFIFSIAWNRFDADLDELTGSISGGTQIGAVSGTIPASTLEAAGFDFDNTVDIYTANIYYEFEITDKFKPYVGVGYGLADIDNAKDDEGTLVWSVGGRYDMTDKVSLGLKYQRFDIDGPTDKLGIDYKDMDVDNISITLGYNF